MRAVVMAAGLGTRLRPLTDLYAKPVLPIDGVPVVEHVLRELAAAGCVEVALVVGHHEEQVRRLCGDGTTFGLELRYAVQEEALGSAHAVAVAEQEPPYLVLGADTVFTAGDLGAFARGFAGSGAVGALAVTRRRADEPARNGVLVRDGRVDRLLDAAGTHTGAPLWAAGPGVAERIRRLPGAPPHELAAAFQGAIDAGEPVAGIEIGPTRDLTSPADLLRENFPYLSDL